MKLDASMYWGYKVKSITRGDPEFLDFANNDPSRLDCEIEGPEGRFVCCRPVGHEGIHIAYTSKDAYAAVWFTRDFFENAVEEACLSKVDEN